MIECPNCGHTIRERFYVSKNWSNKVFVKEEQFFISQGGLKESWGKHWTGPIEADGIEHARLIGIKMLGGIP